MLRYVNGLWRNAENSGACLVLMQKLDNLTERPICKLNRLLFKVVSAFFAQLLYSPAVAQAFRYSSGAHNTDKIQVFGSNFMVTRTSP